MKFSPLDSKGNYAQVPYTKVKEALVNAILKDGSTGASDVAQSIDEEAAINLIVPTLKAATATDPAAKAIQEKEYEIQYKEDIRRYNTRKDNLDEGLKQAYGKVRSDYMTQGMISRIENLPNYEREIKGNVIALLKAIKAATHEAARAQYPMITMTDALTKFLTFKQVDGMSLTEYLHGFRENRDILETQMGDHVLDYFIEQQQEYTDSQCCWPDRL